MADKPRLFLRPEMLLRDNRTFQEKADDWKAYTTPCGPGPDPMTIDWGIDPRELEPDYVSKG